MPTHPMATAPIIALTLALSACATPELTPAPPPEADSGAEDAPAPEDAPEDLPAPPPEDAPPAATPVPDPTCLVPEVSGEAIAVSPGAPALGEAFEVSVTGDVGHTNVGLRLCTPTGLIEGEFIDVAPGFTWRWRLPGAPEGLSQIIFVADPDDRVYSTASLTLGATPEDPDPDPTPEPPPNGDLCASPPGNIIPNGDFEQGLEGLVPRGWQVRTPGQPEACGDPSAHLFLAAPPPGCPGQSLTIDARGQWDCYAVQVVTDYNTISGGATYRFRASIRSEGQDNPAAWFVVGLQWLDSGDRFFGDLKNPQPTEVNFDWTVREYELTAPPEARRALIWLTAHYPGRVTYDNLSLTAR